MFFRRPIGYMRRPWGVGYRRPRVNVRFCCLPGCLTLLLAGLALAAVVVALL